MTEKFNIILNTTTACNYRCSYCSVVKDGKTLSDKLIGEIIDFVERNTDFIHTFKFFWGEPLLSFENIKHIIDQTGGVLWNKFEIVTNTSLITNEVWEYFSKYFETIFFSIDSENDFDYKKVFAFIAHHNIKDKIYFNLIISPWKENIAIEQFNRIYSNWYKNFNILPVYFTKNWIKKDLLELSFSLRQIIEVSLKDGEMKLYGFQKNNWYNYALTYPSLFLDIDSNIYYSDFVSTSFWKDIKNSLLLGRIQDINLSQKIDVRNQKNILLEREKTIIKDTKWQKELHQIMDYFSLYLNKNNNAQ